MAEPENRDADTNRSPAQERLSQLWEEHVRYEFSTRNTEDTLATMVEDAYVNHIPVLTGGVGKDELREFYSKRFIPQMPPDTEMTPVSRTIGEVHSYDSHGLDVAGCRSYWKASRDSASGHCSIQKRQVGSRAYLLGSSIGTGSDWIARPCPAARRRR